MLTLNSTNRTEELLSGKGRQATVSRYSFASIPSVKVGTTIFNHGYCFKSVHTVYVLTPFLFCTQGTSRNVYGSLLSDSLIKTVI